MITTDIVAVASDFVTTSSYLATLAMAVKMTKPEEGRHKKEELQTVVQQQNRNRLLYLTHNITSVQYEALMLPLADKRKAAEVRLGIG